MVRAGFVGLLATQPDFAVVGTAGDGAEAVRICRELRPDVVLMDVRMPGMDGIEATRQLAGPTAAGPRVLILTTFDLDEYVYDALRAGASGFLLKDVTAERLFDACASSRRRGAARADRHAPSDQRVRPAAPGTGAPPTGGLAALTPRETRCSAWSPRACPTRRSRRAWSSPRKRSRPT